MRGRTGRRDLDTENLFAIDQFREQAFATQENVLEQRPGHLLRILPGTEFDFVRHDARVGADLSDEHLLEALGDDAIELHVQGGQQHDVDHQDDDAKAAGERVHHGRHSTLTARISGIPSRSDCQANETLCEMPSRALISSSLESTSSGRGRPCCSVIASSRRS